ncbi:MAG: 4Fe-4S dicluster domain-containing protein, partial [Desulfocapsaceae bacterium]|nr:4Fe-4S dicluster domain-containing protein [Desulfocapsaceae bacterium]
VKVLKVTPAELDAMMQQWSKAHRVYVPALVKQPAASPDCAPGWRRVDGSGALILSTGPTPASVKTFFFPQPETLLTYTLENNHPDKGLMREPEKSKEMQVVVGVRPCDARSVLLNNLPYQEDPFFQTNRRRTVLVGFTCNQALSTCFCTLMGGSPLGSEGLDLAFSRTQDGFIVEVGSAKGEALVTGLDLAPADESEITALAARRQEEVKVSSTELDTLKGRELGKLYDAPLWQPLGESCINCGACTFICPTCYCFDIQDEVVRGQGRRIRYWDSCMFPLYSLHTSGHNPRGQKVQRTRNRFLHKLKYFPDRFGPFSCVGCGRCVQDCPVNIDIREVMNDLLAVE